MDNSLFKPNLDSEAPSQLNEKELFLLAANKTFDQSFTSYLAGKTSGEQFMDKIKKGYELLIESSKQIE